MQQPSNILVVDDADTVLHMMQYSLAKAGYKVHTAHNGLEALEVAQAHKFDVIFTDIHMPEMDGISLIKALRELPDYEHTPILALTMTNTDTIKQTGKQAGATGWVSKPVSPPKILDLLERFGLVATPHLA
ncbi:MAG: response regulator [Gammaproteobacteria bacterium]|nr:response regulator [Gammaproteobacteria bacterium]